MPVNSNNPVEDQFFKNVKLSKNAKQQQLLIDRICEVLSLVELMNPPLTLWNIIVKMILPDGLRDTRNTHSHGTI